MKRREFIASGLSCSLAASAGRNQPVTAPTPEPQDLRSAFPRLRDEVYLNAAGLMPLGAFSKAGLQRYMAFQETGPDEGRDDYIGDMWSRIRGLFAKTIGADEAEIGLVHCTKAGEQIALDAVDHIRQGGAIVTNDLHFSGSLHNLIGLRKAGRDVRIVKARNWRTPVEDMAAAIDERTAVVALTLVSNVNGHLADIKEIAKIAHARGALVYADIIQAAGVVPLDMREMDIDIAACSCYKWLYGVYGSGFLYVRKAVQGGLLPDRLFPGRAHPNYPPWIDEVNPEYGEFEYRPKDNAARYEPGHVNYMGYCAAYEGLKWLARIGVENALKRSVALNQRLVEKLDAKKYVCISPDIDRTPIATFIAKDIANLRKKLAAAKITVSISGNRIRVSPALYNNEADIDALSAVLNAHS